MCIYTIQMPSILCVCVCVCARLCVHVCGRACMCVGMHTCTCMYKCFEAYTSQGNILIPTRIYSIHSNLFQQLWLLLTQSTKEHQGPVVIPHAQQCEHLHCSAVTSLGIHRGCQQFHLVVLKGALRVQLSENSTQAPYSQLLNDVPFQQMYYKSVVLICIVVGVRSTAVIFQPLEELRPAW